MMNAATKTITARFAGTCCRCGCRFNAGTEIEWRRGAGSVHVVCPSIARKPEARTARWSAAYRELRASCSRHSATEFDAVASAIAGELADGEDVTEGNWIHAARIILSGRDYA